MEVEEVRTLGNTLPHLVPDLNPQDIVQEQTIFLLLSLVSFVQSSGFGISNTGSAMYVDHPSVDALNACRLATAGKDEGNGTFTKKRDHCHGKKTPVLDGLYPSTYDPACTHPG